MIEARKSQGGRRMSFLRVYVWKLVFLTVLLLNVLMFYYGVVPMLERACPHSENTPLAAAYGYGSWPAEDETYSSPHAASQHSCDHLSSQLLLSSSSAEECSGERESTMAWFLCLAQASVVFHSPHTKPLVLAKDVTRSRYFAQRDLQGWTIAFEEIGFSVQEVHQRSVGMSEFSVFLCLGIVAQDRLCLRPHSYGLLGQGQRFNQIHGLREYLWRKDGMCLTLREALAGFEGPRNFTFPCWVLPMDITEFREKVESEPRPYIVKPNDRGEGNGIFVAETIAELDKHILNGHVAQPLLTDPYLIQGRKFDFRTYVLVTSVAPLRAYFYNEGLVRFASSSYNSSEANRGRESQVLTNTSVGKKYTHLSNLTWTFKRLSDHLSSKGVDTECLFTSIHETIIRTLLSAEYRLLKDFHVSLGGYSCNQCYHLLGVDVILDSHLNPYVIEVNGMPSMQLSNDLGAPPDPASPYTATKLGLLRDTLQILFNSSQSVVKHVRRDLETLRVGLTPGPLCRSEHHVFCIDLRDLQTIVQSRQEFIHRGNYQRIYPSPDSQKYSQLIKHMHRLVQRRFRASGFTPPKTNWDSHHLFLALERMWTL